MITKLQAAVTAAEVGDSHRLVEAGQSLGQVAEPEVHRSKTQQGSLETALFLTLFAIICTDIYYDRQMAQLNVREKIIMARLPQAVVIRKQCAK